MHVVSLDLSLTASGVADSRTMDSRVISPPRGLSEGARLLYLQKAIDQATAGADLVVREGYAMGTKNMAHVRSIGELGGVVRLTLHCRNRPLVEIPPSTLKKFATGKGNAPKEAMLQAAWQRLGYTGHDNNVSDALWLLQAALVHYGLPGAVQMPKANVAALGAVDWPVIEAHQHEKAS